MILSIVVILAVAVVAYVHYVQGFFSAALSAFIAIISATVSLAYTDYVVRTLLQGKAADEAYAFGLIGLFAVSYLVLRIIFDKALPGNVLVPVGLDKIGAGLMGVVAGVFGAGIFAIAAQSLPFGPNLAGVVRYTTVDTTALQVPTNRQALDTNAYDLLKNDHIDPADASGMFLPVDDIVVNMTRRVSDGGALAGATSFSALHPALLDELFFQRLGVQTGARHVAFNSEKEKQVELKALYTLDVVPQADGAATFIKDRFPNNKLAPTVKSENGKIILVVRLSFSRNATDSDSNVRIGAAGLRLVANGKNYLPIGTLQLDNGPVLRANRPDDFLLIKGDGAADFVFNIPRDEFGIEADAKGKPAGDLALGNGIFIEAKRMADIDLSGEKISRTIPAKPEAGLLRQTALPEPSVAPGSGATAAKEAAVEGPLSIGRVTASATLFTKINVGSYEGDASVTFKSGTASIKDKKFAKLEVNAVDSLALLTQGDFLIDEFFAPAGQSVVQVSAAPSNSISNKWEWADKLGSFELVDAKGQSYKAHGAAAKVKQGTTYKLVARWDSGAPIDSFSADGELRPTDVYLLYVIPTGAQLREVRFGGQRVKSIDVTSK